MSNGCKLAGALLVASSLGALAGCGRETSSAFDTGSTTQTATPDNTAPGSITGSNTPSPACTTSGNVNCRFYDDGICSKTGQSCTNCMENQNNL